MTFLRFQSNPVKVVHLLVGGGPNYMAGGEHRLWIWCKERSDVSPPDSYGGSKDYNTRRVFNVTSKPNEVTCKRCIDLGGCGPDWTE